VAESATRAWRRSLKVRVAELRSETLALYLAARHPGTPWHARLLVAAIVAYALSPIDLIPDFVPILGYVDDLLLIPLGIAFAIKLIPAPVLIECRARAREAFANGAPRGRVVAAIIVTVWLFFAVLGALWAYSAFSAPSPR
jgi:uncharacterized membrane protein YkvA (DUF1232 family)